MYGELRPFRRIGDIGLHRSLEGVIKGHDSGRDLALPEPAFSAPDMEPSPLQRSFHGTELVFIHQSKVRHWDLPEIARRMKHNRSLRSLGRRTKKLLRL